MRTSLVVGVAAVVLTAAAAVTWFVATRPPVVALTPPFALDAVTSAVADTVDGTTGVGIAAGIVADGRTVWTGRAGVPQDAVFQAGSISKTVAAATVLTLAEQGRVDLDAPVDTVLRSWPTTGFPRPEQVTLRTLLSHTAGVDTPGYLGQPADRPLPSTAGSLDGATTGAPVRQSGVPGTYDYSGGGYTIAQQVVEDVTGRPFAEVARDEFLEPTGLTGSGYDCTQSAAPGPRDAAGHLMDGSVAPRYRYVEAAAAGFCTTIDDVARLAVWLGSDDPRAAAMRAPAPGTGGRYGLGVEVWSTGTVGHPGVNRGFHADLWVDPEAAVGLVVLTDGDSGGAAADSVLGAWNEAAAGG